MNAPHTPHLGADRETILDFLRGFMAKAMPNEPSEEDIHIPFLEMGANSLVLMEVQRAVETNYGLTITLPQFFQELTNIDALTTYIEQNQVIPEAPVAAPVPAAAAAPQPAAPRPAMAAPSVALPQFQMSRLPTGGGSDMEQILARQLESASKAINQVVAQQLQFLNTLGGGAAPAVPALQPAAATQPAFEAAKPSVAQPAATTTNNAKPAATTAGDAKPAETKPASSSALFHRMLSPLEIRARGLTPQQQQHLEALITRFTNRTKLSKELAARHRPALADSRAAVGFRFTTKEMLYPIVGKRAAGSHVWDVDGNEYIDITMGQGVTLFGHHPAFIDAALNDPENDILMLGPRPPQVGEAAELIRELTGMERVTFTNTGTEAVMAAMRLARAATRRNKVVMFENAYHGHADNVMGRSVWQDGMVSSVPVAPGITQGAVDDLWVLEYGTDATLDFIRKHVHELAAVIVEPVQSRRPDLQPREFLQELRRITEKGGALLIFDEMITGFRIHPGGAQAWFGIRADIATYGKVLGGGMPIGVVAGHSKYMDAIDGGMWNYGDASYPMVDRTVFGGTFCQHPTAMITTLATLRHLKEQGPALQEAMNRRTVRLAVELNAFFDAEEIPIKVVHFGSLFRFAFTSNLELLFYHLMERGIFIWEWRNYFLSTAHTDEDVAKIIQAVKESVSDMRAGGFLPERSQVDASPQPLTPLSEAQRQLNVLAQISPEGSMAYHVSPLLKLQGRLETGALAGAVKDVMRRHESLRTVIEADQQRVLPLEKLPGGGAMTVTDLSAETDPAAALAAAQAAHARKPFDLALGPLFEAHLLRLAPEDHRLLLKAHHIVVDGLSMNLIVQEIAALYTSAINGNNPNLPTPLQLRDYNQWRATTQFPEQEAYWTRQLQGELPVLDVPADRPEPLVKSYRGGRLSRNIPVPLFTAVRNLSRAQGCTHFMTLLSAYALWLHRLCGQDEVLVGMPVAGRGMKGSDNLIGYCTHLIAIRSQATWDQPFAVYLKAMRDTLLQGYQHQDYPFAELINKLSVRRDGRRAPLVSALFNLDRPGAAPTMPGLDVTWISQGIAHTAFDLTLNLTEIGDDMVLECDFNADLFEEASVAGYVGNFITLLEGIVADPQQTLARLPLLDAADRKRQLLDWNATAQDYPRDRCAHQLFEQQVALTPQAVAVRFGDQALSYAELNGRANRLAGWLRSQQVGAEVVVGVCAERSVELVVALLAIMKAGGAYLPLDPDYPPQRLAYMLEDAGSKLLLTQQSLLSRLGEHIPAGVQTLCLEQRERYETGSDQNLNVTANAEQLAYLIYTSGSTGRPKGTLITHRGLVNYLSWALQRYEVAAGDGAPLHSSISFDATITSLFAPLLAGRCLSILPEGGVEIDHIRAALQSGQNWSLVKLTPSHLELINAMIPAEELAGLTRYVVLGGEALLGRHVAVWTESAPETRLINEYGPTETVVGCCIYEVGESDVVATSGIVPIGRPIANTRLYVLDRNLQPVPVGVKGELFIGGDGVARGYHGRPDVTAERFIAVAQTGLGNDVPAERLYRTGDVVKYLGDGNLLYLGRVDNQIKVRGYRIELGEIESVLAHQAGVREAVVTAQRRSERDVRLIAYWVPNNDIADLDERALRAALAAELPDHMVPGVFVKLDKLPLTANGKVDRAALPLPEGLRAELGAAHLAAFVDPRNDAEKRIAAVWRELLGVERVGADDNFFELGGHSLLVLPLREKLQAMFGRPVSPVDIFRFPTVSTQASHLTGDAADTAAEDEEVRRTANRRREAFRQMKDKRRG